LPRPRHTGRDLERAPPLRALRGSWCCPVRRTAVIEDRWRICLLNETGEIAHAWQWNDPAKPKRWLYNLHYFDDLAASPDAERCSRHRDLIARWIAENRPTTGNGWEPYPLSLRIVNWIKWALAGNNLDPTGLDSLAAQVRWLARNIEWHL